MCMVMCSCGDHISYLWKTVRFLVICLSFGQDPGCFPLSVVFPLAAFMPFPLFLVAGIQRLCPDVPAILVVWRFVYSLFTHLIFHLLLCHQDAGSWQSQDLGLLVWHFMYTRPASHTLCSPRCLLHAGFILKSFPLKLPTY